MVYRFSKKEYIPISNSQGGDENISSFCRIGQDNEKIYRKFGLTE
jgi:hypothetical protein